VSAKPERAEPRFLQLLDELASRLGAMTMRRLWENKGAKLRRPLERLFAVDLRTLGVFRMGLAVLLLIDLARRWPLAHTFLTRDGVLPWHPNDAWGLYALLDSPAALQASLLLSVAAGACFLLGLWTRAAGVTSAILLLSLHARNPWILDGGDTVLGQLLIWSLLLPCEACFSLDARRRPTRAKAERVLSFPAAGLRLQIAFIYLFSALHKLKGTSWREGTAVHDVLSQALWARPLARLLVEHPDLCTALNYFALSVELLAPLLLFSPWKAHASRAVGVGLLVLLQLGIGTSLRMGLFPWIMTWGLFSFVPTSFWTRFSQISVLAPHPHTAHAGMQRVGAALLVFVLLSNVKSLSSRLNLPWKVERLERSTGMYQSWSMYAPNPYALDFGMAIRATLSDGTSLELDDGRHARTWQPLEQIWRDYRGGMYMEHISDTNWRDEQEAFAAWIRREWEGADTQKRKITVIALELVEWKPAAPGTPSITPLYTWGK
jgi:hypothetical protein